MELLKFIKAHDNWKELLKEKPYCLEIKEDEGYTLLKYSQIYSDFREPIVKECRGIILDKDNNIVCWPFDKFFNYGESYADEIDWSSAKVQEKIDGSIMKLWWAQEDHKWRLSTNGCIDAYKVELNINEMLKVNCPFINFGELFEHAKNYGDLNLDSLDKGFTYMFELVSPYNKVVIAYPEIIINHIGTRDNKTGKEQVVDIGVRKPKEYQIHTLEDCVKSAEALPNDAEGYVVVDKYWRRVKVKNPVYLQLHRMVSNNQLQTKDVLQMIFENDQEEFLNYFPEYREAFEEVENKLEMMRKRFASNYVNIKACLSTGPYTQKDFALKVMETDKENSSYYFLREKQGTSFEDWVKNMPKDKLVDKINNWKN